jgi:hypothetical protein
MTGIRFDHLITYLDGASIDDDGERLELEKADNREQTG